MLNFYRNHWFRLTFPAFTALAFYMMFWGVHELSNIQIILMASLMALLIHQFEEYVMPGGAPVIINVATFHETEHFLKYPGNMHSSMLVNTIAHVVYIVAIFCPDMIWLGLATMFFNLFQFVGHGIQMNKALKTWYNPGLASVIFLFIPIASYYIYYISVNDLATWTTWGGAVVGFVAFLLGSVILPVQLNKSLDTPYPISEEQFEKYQKITQLCRIK